MSEPQAYTVTEFCAAHRISRNLFYTLLRKGLGPRVAKAGRKTLVTADAARAWRHRLEATPGDHPPVLEPYPPRM